MRQVVLTGPGQLELVEASVPEPGPGEVLVKVKATAICGTDVHIYHGRTPVEYPRVPGHEVAGVVAALGAGASGLDVGDAVVVNPNLDCGQCEPLRTPPAVKDICKVTACTTCEGRGSMFRGAEWPCKGCLGLGLRLEPVADPRKVLPR